MKNKLNSCEVLNAFLTFKLHSYLFPREILLSSARIGKEKITNQPTYIFPMRVFVKVLDLAESQTLDNGPCLRSHYYCKENLQSILLMALTLSIS